ncbi:hypothetical protein L1887_43600 [Cichorium endivia]|nr:hypothetical protein L1887_43600 [Cichorium endivia]
MARKRQERGNGQRNNANHGKPAQRVRSHSTGEYRRIPTAPRPINVSSTHILDNVATKTLLAILRAHWPAGKYYCYHPGVSNAEGDAVVKQHVARTMTQALYEDRNRAEIRAEREGTSLLEQCPTYYSMRVWRSFCNHWRKRSFKRKSVTNKQNREKLRVVHTTGAKSFNKFKEDLTRKYNEPPTPVQFWEESHKLKDTDEWASEEARLIGERMQKILESKESTPDSDSGISVLLEAQGPIKKNRIIGLPRVRANSVVPHGQPSRGTQRTRSNSTKNTNEKSVKLVPRDRVDSVVRRPPRGNALLQSSDPLLRGVMAIGFVVLEEGIECGIFRYVVAMR